MRIDAERWLAIFGVCTLGWVCGFIIYSTFLRAAVLEQTQAIEVEYLSEPHVLSIPLEGMAEGLQPALQPAIVRLVVPQTGACDCSGRGKPRLWASPSFYL